MPLQEPLSKVTRAEQRELTRQRLLEATIDLIAEEGLSKVTMAKVAERTGFSRGICGFHFNTKEQLLLETFQMVYGEYDLAWRAAMADPLQTPAERVTGYLRSLLFPPIGDPKKLCVWLAFWGMAAHRQVYLEACLQTDLEYEVAVESMLRQLAPGRETINGMSMRAIAVALTGMIDGFHLQYVIAPHRLSPGEACRACLVYLGGFFPEFAPYLEKPLDSQL